MDNQFSDMIKENDIKFNELKKKFKNWEKKTFNLN